MRIPELLAPVGSMDYLKVAINAGASSVYLSGKNYGARKFAENFTLDEISIVCAYCHEREVKVYLTLNTLIFDNELKDALTLCQNAYEAGIDAVIVQDLGLATLIKKSMPKLRLLAGS